jgi:uncharacterized protein with GYD domain
MQTYILLTRLVSEETHPTFSITKRERAVTDNIRELLPEIEWTANYAIMGPWDYLDVFKAPSTEAAMKVSSLVRYYGGAHTEIWPAMEWDHFNTMVRDLAQGMEK